jgi:hypothetical protein
MSLSPFLNIGLWIGNFNLLGKSPKERDLLQIYITGEVMSDVISK